MLRRLLPIALASAALAAAFAPAPAPAHEGNPNFLSTVRSITPAIPGFSVNVINGDDSLEAVHRGGEQVIIEGYKKEPYIRMDPDGKVSVNLNSEAYYVNQERFGGVKVPATADIGAAPNWKLVARTGRFIFHDHRMHYMTPNATPQQVKDESKRTKIFDWRVDLESGGRQSVIAGDLFWRGKTDDGTPVGAYIGMGALVLLSGALVVVVRRRRGRLELGDGADDAEPRKDVKEAW